MARTQYAIITPKEGADPPKNTRQGWAFMHDSTWYPIGKDRPYTPEMADHAINFFTSRPASGEPFCLVDVEMLEGELTLQPLGPKPEHKCPVDGCGEVFTDVGELSQHIVECATRTTEERLAAKGEEPDADKSGKPQGRRARTGEKEEQDDTHREKTEG